MCCVWNWVLSLYTAPLFSFKCVFCYRVLYIILPKIRGVPLYNFTNLGNLSGRGSRVVLWCLFFGLKAVWVYPLIFLYFGGVLLFLGNFSVILIISPPFLLEGVLVGYSIFPLFCITRSSFYKQYFFLFILGSVVA